MGAGELAAGTVVGYLLATRDGGGKQSIKLVGGTPVETSPIVNIDRGKGGDINQIYLPQSRGITYENEAVMTDDNPKRFHEKTVVVSDLLVRVSQNDMVFGNENNQRFVVAAGDVFSIRECDLSTLCFRNKTNGSNGQVNVIGTRR